MLIRHRLVRGQKKHPLMVNPSHHDWILLDEFVMVTLVSDFYGRKAVAVAVAVAVDVTNKEFSIHLS